MTMFLRTLSLVTLIVSIDAYRILGLFPFPGKSHWTMCNSIMMELAKKGHQVDVVSPFPLKEPISNYKSIIVESKLSVDIENDVTVNMVNTVNPLTMVIAMARLNGNELCEQLKDEPLKSLIQNKSKDAYDIVIVEVFTANCYLAYGHHFDAPTVGVTSSVMLPWANKPMGNVDNPSYIPNYLLSYTEHMDFWQRLVNTVFTQYSKIGFNLVTRRQDEILKEAFGPDMPGLRELEKKIDLLLVNSHYSLNSVRPLTPGVVEVGGLHIRNDIGILSPELARWLNESSSGVVLFSMGSMLKTESFSPEVLANFYASFAKLAPIRVLWKANKELLPEGLPANVLTMNWIPQALVLRHENVKAFITHGGLLGTQEAIHAGVPLIGIAMYGDQALNINNYANKKVAISIDKYEITQDTLDTALNLILHDRTYQENARRMSNRLRDRPLSALDTAVWWIEYIGRHGKGALRSPSVDLKWWQLALLDVYGFLILSVILIFYLLRLVMKKLLTSFMNYLQLKSKKIQ